MAIDGVNIIDSDTAHDIYNAVVEGYRDGEDVETIIKNILADEADICFNDMETEIYWTAFAYSLWKIGHLNDDIRQKTLTLIENGACEKWLEIDKNAQKSRQKALNALAEKIKSDNPRPLKRPKLPKTPKVPHFSKGDVLAIKFEHHYGACLVYAVIQTPRKIEYHLACTRLLQPTLPTLDEVLNSQIAGARKALYLKTDCWINHRAFTEISPNFQKLGKIQWESSVQLSVYSPCGNLAEIYEEITADRKIHGFYLRDIWDFIAAILEE